MNIDDDSKAISYLDKIGYYRLSGYWYPFRKINSKDNVVKTGKKKGKHILRILDLIILLKMFISSILSTYIFLIRN